MVLTLDAVDGVRPQTRKLWSHIRAAGLPAIVFINKMDRERANFDMALGGLTSTLGMKPVVFYMPILDKDAFVGLVDVFAGKALMFGENGEVTEAPVPEDLADEAALLRDTAVENIAESDEDLMNKYLDEGALSPEEIDLGLRKGVLAGDIVPVLVGSALANKEAAACSTTSTSCWPRRWIAPPGWVKTRTATPWSAPRPRISLWPAWCSKRSAISFPGS